MLDLDELPHAISLLLSAPDENIRTEADQWLQAWLSDLPSLPHALQLLESSPDEQLAFFSARKILHHLLNSLPEFTPSDLESIFNTCGRRLASGLSATDSASEAEIADCMAVITVHLGTPIDCFSDLSPPLAVLFLEHGFHRMFQPDFNPEPAVYEALMQRVPAVVDLLHRCPISRNWLSLHSSAIALTPELVRFSPFFPSLRRAMRNPTLLPGLINLYETVLNFEPTGLDPVSLGYVANLIGLFVPFAVWLLNTEFDETRWLAASMIWSVLLEYGFDFFIAPRIVRFSLGILEKFLECVPRFQATPDEFFGILELAARLLGRAAKWDDEAQQVIFGPLAVSFLNFVMELANDNPDIDADRVGAAVNSLTQWNSSIVYSLLKQLSQNPSPAVFLIVAWSPEMETQRELAGDLAGHLEETTETAGLAFIRHCCLLLPEHAETMFQLAYHCLANRPAEAAGAVRALGAAFPAVFDAAFESAFAPLLLALSRTTFLGAENILGTIFASLPLVASRMGEEVWVHIGNSVLVFLSHVIAQENLLYVRTFLFSIFADVDCAVNRDFFDVLGCSILESIGELRNHALYGRILADVLNLMLSKNFFNNIEPIARLVCEGMVEDFAPYWFKVLRKVAPFVPREFVETIPLGDNPDLHYKFLRFMAAYLTANPADFFEVMNLEVLLLYTASPAARVVDAALRLLTAILRQGNDTPREVSGRILESIAHGLLEVFPQTLFLRSIMLLRTVALQFDAMCVLGFVLGTPNVLAPQFQPFVAAFTSDSVDEAALESATRAMVAEHRCHQA
jgi:hypothetical protein